MGENLVLRLCAEVIRAAAGMDDYERPVMEPGAEECRRLALRAKDQNDALRARVAELEGALALVPREWWAQIDEAEGVAIPAIADLFATQGGGEGG